MPQHLVSRDPGAQTGLGFGFLDATVAELNSLADASARVVASTSTALGLTATQHANRLVDWKPNSSGAATITMPAATGTGNRYEIINDLAQTQGSLVVAALGTDVFKGVAKAFDATAAADATYFPTTATSDKATLNRTTQGGLGYDRFRLLDIGSGEWLVDLETYGSGSLATPFSAS